MGEGGDVFLCTHAPHMWRLLDHSQAQHEQAEAPPPVGTQSSRTAPRARRWNDASGTGGRETKAPSANCAHASRNNGERERPAAACLPPAQHPPSGIIANCIDHCARTERRAAKNRSLTFTLCQRVQILGHVFGHTALPTAYDDRMDDRFHDSRHIWLCLT